MSTNRPKISIVTPSFNQGPFIEQAIQSVLSQGYESFEHVIVDNCSTDETLDILRKYPHLIWVSEPDEGQSDAINKGFQLASGEVIGWLNADDYYLPNTFHSVAENLTEKYDGVYANVRFVDAAGKFMRNLTSHRPSKWLILFYTFIQSTTFFFNRKVVDQGIRIDKDFHLTMDREFFANLLFKNYRLKFVKEYYAAFRWQGNNKSTPTPKVLAASLKENLIIINRYLGTSFTDHPFTIR
ncbi:MAG: glycosyltransferase family 2 protein, partial [Bacteroidota bacterium]